MSTGIRATQISATQEFRNYEVDPLVRREARIVRLMLLVLALITAPVVSTVAADPPGNTSEGRLEHAVEIPTPEGLLHRVRFTYAFPHRDSVYVEDFGTITASGTLAQLTAKRQITIRASPDGPVLANIPIANAIQFMGGDQFEMPQESAFPESQHHGMWANKAPFVQTATMEVLPSRFPNGCLPYLSGERQAIRTAYCNVPFADKRITIQVALLLTCPVESPPPFQFSARFCARQRRSHSGWRDRLEPESEVAVQAFIADFMTAIGAAGKHDKPPLPAPQVLPAPKAAKEHE